MTQFPQIPVPEHGEQESPRDSRRCSWCGASNFEPGFIEDSGQSSRGFARWIVGDLEKGIFGVSPFESLDVDGVGRLVQIAATEGRATRPDLKLGICGEHGGDPDSIHHVERIGLDYVSCSPWRVPVARLEAARATLSTR